tara:strand:- start:176237 stop:176431 length:195 start_codon:yes stop_codon:yes gene_type:complete
MKIVFGILCIGVGITSLYFILKNDRVLNSLRELETDRGISYYAGLFAAIVFLIMGVSLIINFFQ